MELPVPVVRAVPSADGSATEPCARSDDAAAAAKVASRAQTEHAEHLQGLLRALQLPGGAAVAQRPVAQRRQWQRRRPSGLQPVTTSPDFTKN